MTIDGATNDVTTEAADSNERCGRCGELVPPGLPVCPACGALLDAYRTPSESPSPEINPDDEPFRPSGDPVNPVRMVKVVEPASSNEDAADSDGEAMPEPTTRLNANDVKPESSEERAASPTAQTVLRQEPTLVSRTLTETQRPPTPPTRRPTAPNPAWRPTVADKPSRPRRPGYVTRGTVEPVIVLGVVLLVLAVCLVTLASLVSVPGIAVTGFVFGAAGIIGIVVAILVALIRREREIG